MVSARRGAGFTLVELLVVMAIIALLLTLAAPRYFRSVTTAEETVLKENLVLMRDAIDKHYGDHGKYPASLDDLVQRRYLRSIPPDPITKSAGTWVVVPPPDPSQGGVYDVRSGAPGEARDGRPYADL
ncbi:MAG TPA: type II secretion system protein [Pelomicrobium sp.]|nr:type II secretion system protein [Pelomicrobium sp.]